MTILVTGAAGFIGYHLSAGILASGARVIGCDNLNSYYDVSLKQARLSLLHRHPNFKFVKADLANIEDCTRLFEDAPFNQVFHLAAQAGVRYSMINPYAYGDANLTGLLNLLEQCRKHPPDHLLFASSSSVYGASKDTPFNEQTPTDRPLSLYAATKKANEVMAYSYANLYHIPITGMRFFTVYGPFGRPDMAAFIFTTKILQGQPIDIFNQGRHSRDFTYIDDVVKAVMLLGKNPPAGIQAKRKDGADNIAYRIVNIGRGQPVQLLDFISLIETNTGCDAKLNFKPLQPGDVESTHSDISLLQKLTGYHPEVSIEEGVARLVYWYKQYFGL